MAWSPLTSLKFEQAEHLPAEGKTSHPKRYLTDIINSVGRRFSPKDGGDGITFKKSPAWTSPREVNLAISLIIPSSLIEVYVNNHNYLTNLTSTIQTEINRRRHHRRKICRPLRRTTLYSLFNFRSTWHVLLIAVHNQWTFYRWKVTEMESIRMLLMICNKKKEESF